MYTNQIYNFQGNINAVMTSSMFTKNTNKQTQKQRRSLLRTTDIFRIRMEMMGKPERTYIHQILLIKYHDICTWCDVTQAHTVRNVCLCSFSTSFLRCRTFHNPLLSMSLDSLLFQNFMFLRCTHSQLIRRRYSSMSVIVFSFGFCNIDTEVKCCCKQIYLGEV